MGPLKYLRHTIKTIEARRIAPQRWSQATYMIERSNGTPLPFVLPSHPLVTARTWDHFEARGKVDLGNLNISVWLNDGTLKLGTLKPHIMVDPSRYLRHVLANEWPLVLSGHTLIDDIEVE